jgi:hypothetical protein
VNERIRTFINGCFDVYVDHRGREDFSTDYAGIERFADLIVRECAELSIDYPGNVKLLILNHFGMEP